MVNCPANISRIDLGNKIATISFEGFGPHSVRPVN